MNCLALIPARGGSKRIPRKNVKSFLGKPVIAYSIDAALKSGLFDSVMVSTDDEEIAAVSKQYGAEIPFMRSLENSNDYAGISDVCIEVIESYASMGKFFDTICCILPTAPFVKPENLVRAEKLLNEKEYNCVFAIAEYSYPIQRSLKIVDGIVSMNWPENFSKRSQDLEKSYHDAGQFYFIKTDALLHEKKIFTSNAGSIVMNELEVQDIDTETDWKIAELKYKIINNI